MYIDPRVAHGVVKTALPKLFQSKAHIEELLQSKLQDALKARDESYDQSRRRFKRLLEKWMLKPLAKHGIDAEVGEVRDAPSMAPLCITTKVMVGSAQTGIEYIWFYLYPEHNARYKLPPPVHSKVLVRVTAHALARLMHRTGNANVAEVTMWAWAPLTTAARLHELAKEEGWKQFGAPAASGLFVGNILDDDTWEFTTWFIPGASGQNSRWSTFIEELCVPVLNELDGEKIVKRLMAWTNRVITFNLIYRVPFIRETYHGSKSSE